MVIQTLMKTLLSTLKNEQLSEKNNIGTNYDQEKIRGLWLIDFFTRHSNDILWHILARRNTIVFHNRGSIYHSN